MKFLWIIFICLFFQANILADQIEWEIAFQQAIFQEEIIGNLSKAMEIYQRLLKEKIPRRVQAKIQLRIAFCYEKLGKLAEAKKLYSHILVEYSDNPAIARLVNSQLREYSRREQIDQLQQQLESLKKNSPQVRAKLEQEIQKLQAKINILQNRTEETKEEKNKQGKKEDSGKANKTLSIHLYQSAKNFYQQGFLDVARENLKNALALDPTNQKARDLLKKVETIMAYRNAPNLMERIAVESMEKDEQMEHLFAIPSKEIEERSYDPKLLIKKWQIPEDNKVWIANLTKLIQDQGYHISVVYQDNLFWVRGSIRDQEKIAQLWISLRQEKSAISVKVFLAPSPATGQKFYWHRFGGVFHPCGTGMFYTTLTDAQEPRLKSYFQRISFRKDFSQTILLDGKKANWEYFLEAPIIRGYREKSLYFRYYSQGLRVTLIRKEKKLYMRLYVQKLHLPIEIIPTLQGPQESIHTIEQQAEVEIELENTKRILIGGIVNPFPDQVSDSRLILSVQLEMTNLRELLLRDSIKNSAEPFITTRDYDLRAYNIGLLKFDAKQLTDKKHERAILQFLKQHLDLTSHPGCKLDILQEKLVAYGPPVFHDKLEELLQALKKKTQTLCRLSVYMASMQSDNFDILLKKWELPEVNDKELSIYRLVFPQETLLKQIKDMEDIQFHYVLGPVVIGNGQLVTLKDWHVQSFMENLHKQDPLIFSDIIDIPNGILVEVRPIISTESKGILDFKASVFDRQGAREIVSLLNIKNKIAWKIPESHSRSLRTHLEFEQGQTLLLTGITPGNMASNRLFLIIVVPEILNANDEDTGK